LVIIRSRSSGDASALESIALETHRLDGYPVYLPDDLKSFIVSDEAIGAWVATRGEAVVGHVALHHGGAPEVMDAVLAGTGLAQDQVAVVARLLVAPTARRRGIGRALLEKARQEASALGRRAVLDVVDEHRAAIELYEQCGWKRVGRVDWSLPGDRPLREYIYLSPDGGR
jgi:GNAT superfamily N-acetyltransferase